MRIVAVAAAAVLVGGACGAGARKAEPPPTTAASSTSTPAAPAASRTTVRIAPPTTSTSVPVIPGGVSGHIELPSTPLVAGTTENGTLVIENLTGAALHLTTGGPTACRPHWTVILTNEQVPQEAAFSAGCDSQPMVLGIGETRLPFTLRSDYQSCSKTGNARDPLNPPCVKDAKGIDASPPLPAGDYRATFFSDIARFIAIESMPVRIVASG